MILLPFFLHWYVKVPDPEAVTEKVTELPAQIACEEGWVVIVGAANTSEIIELPELVWILLVYKNELFLVFNRCFSLEKEGSVTNRHKANNTVWNSWWFFILFFIN